MFCGGYEDALFLQAGGVAHAGNVAANGFNFKAIKVTAAENNACSGSCRQDPERYRRPAMQPYALAFHRSPNCLFKWQVIPTKQITLSGVAGCVVFLPQIVALPNN